MFFVLFLLSVACGVLVFVRLAGSDAWLAKGLREDRIGAVAVTCLLGVCAIALLILLYVLLPLIPASLAAAFAGPDKNLPGKDMHETVVGDIFRWLLLLCIPILSAYLLYWLYLAVHWVIKKSALPSWRPKSR